MIKTGGKDVIIGYVAYFFRLSSNLLLLPVILGMLSSEEYGLWNIFISVGAIVNLVDIGFGSVLTRYSMYAFCGAESIGVHGMPTMSEKNQTNYYLLFRVFLVAKRLYSKLFILSLSISTVLSIYICFKAGTQINLFEVLISWGIYAISCCTYIYYVAYNCMIKGMGKIKESNYYYIVQQIVYLIAGYLFLYLNMGLIGLALANLLSAFVFRCLNTLYLKKRFSDHRQIYNEVKAESATSYEHIYTAVKKNTNGIAWVTVSNYIAHYGMTLVCSFFLPLDEIASIGITNQLVGVVGSIAGTPFATYMSKMGDMLINHQREKLRKLFGIVSGCFFGTYAIGSILIISLGSLALKIIGSDTQLLNFWGVVLLLLSSFITNNHQRCTNFIMLSNEQPHIKAYFISSMVTVILSAICMAFLKNVFGYIIPSLLVQLCYNGWKWPIKVYKEIGLLHEK